METAAAAIDNAIFFTLHSPGGRIRRAVYTLFVAMRYVLLHRNITQRAWDAHREVAWPVQLRLREDDGSFNRSTKMSVCASKTACNGNVEPPRAQNPCIVRTELV